MKNSKKLLRITFLLSLILFSCESDIEEGLLETGITSVNELEATLAAEQLGFEGPEVSKVLFGTKIKVVSLGEGNYALGDMILSEDDFDHGDKQNKGVWYKDKKWPDNIIRYRHSSKMPKKTQEKIKSAAKHITDKTNLTIRKWDKTKDKDIGYVWISYKSGCSAQVGYQAKKFPGQKMNISTSCSLGSTIHEFLHAAGVLHEQAHWNRDDYITVNWDNIIKNRQHNFKKYKKEELTTHSDAMDLNSIMMYGSTYFRTDKAKKEGKWSIETIDGKEIIPNRSYMTANDIDVINKVYKKPSFCSASKWSSSKTYSKGEIVSYKGYKYKSRAFIYAVAPDKSWWWEQIEKCN
ncbi:M12 family metallopeptidase [Aquimarina hainanensis]|uniref:M12 family metallopeptidase n=1 Tax=Aquimarina hainanensis TaxID=1578017 RepID=A0ABW5NAI0_9FLAO